MSKKAWFAIVATGLLLIAGYQINACSEEDFCAKNLDYYEKMCSRFPENMDCRIKGPRRLAHCPDLR